MNEILLKSLKRVKRVVTAVIGFTVILTGLAMTVLPGPAVIVIPVGLAILATEFVWARRLLKKVKARVMNNSSGQTKKNRGTGS